MNTLVRSRDNVIIGGVCGGLGNFLGVNPTFVRIFFILLIFGNGISVILYALFWLMIPLDGQVQFSSVPTTRFSTSQEYSYQPHSSQVRVRGSYKEPQSQLGILVGLALILLGLNFLLPMLHLDWVAWLKFDLIWPVLLIFGGLALLLRRTKGAEK